MGGDLGEENTGGDVVVLQVSGVTNTRKEVVIGQELQVCDVDMLFQLVELDSILVVHENVFLLGHGVERL